MPVIINEFEVIPESGTAPAANSQAGPTIAPRPLSDPAGELGGRNARPRAPLAGVCPALVVNNVDPDAIGRVKIRLPWSPDDGGDLYEVWARIATLSAGNGRGSWFIPEVDDEVLVAFEAGDPRRPYVVGALWNGQDAPPEQMDNAGHNNIRSLVSRNGTRIVMDDRDGHETLTLETAAGQAITLQANPSAVKLLDGQGNQITIENNKITVTAESKVLINANSVEVSAGMLTVNAGMSKFSGVVQADTVITNTVVSAVYTPGAGNIW